MISERLENEFLELFSGWDIDPDLRAKMMKVNLSEIDDEAEIWKLISAFREAITAQAIVLGDREGIFGEEVVLETAQKVRKAAEKLIQGFIIGHAPKYIEDYL